MNEKLQFESEPKISHDFLNLDFVEKEELKLRIEKNKGLVRMFIHPMYEKWRGNESKYINDPDNIKLVEIEKVLSRILSLSEENTPPVIILEEHRFVRELQKWILENPNGRPQMNTYFVSTKENNPTPEIEGEITESCWKTLIDTLKDVGVKRILMGGISLGVDSSGNLEDWTGKQPYMERCVGIAVSHLSRDKAGEFDVDLSALTYPSESRKTFIAHRDLNK